MLFDSLKRLCPGRQWFSKKDEVSPSLNECVGCHLRRRSGEVMSMGIHSSGNPYSIQSDLYYSFPVRLTGRGAHHNYQTLLQTTQDVDVFCRSAASSKHSQLSACHGTQRKAHRRSNVIMTNRNTAQVIEKLNIEYRDAYVLPSKRHREHCTVDNSKVPNKPARSWE
eukprot:5753836-Amphidinium_carterae.2